MRAQLALRIQSLGCFAIGLVVIFAPHFLADFLFWHLIRCLGAQLVATGFLFFRLSYSGNREAHTTLLYAATITFILKFGAILHARATYPEEFNSQALLAELLLHGGVVVLNVVALLRSGGEIGSQLLPKADPSFHYLIYLDVLACTVIGCFWMSFPEWLLKRQTVVTMGGTHIFLGRNMGAMFVGSGFVSAQAIYWKGVVDRRVACYTRCIMCVGIWGAQVWSQVAYGEWWRGTHWVGISLYSVWTILALWVTSKVSKGAFK